jgi:hypothetical protein
MSEALWAQRARPVPGPGASTAGRWEPATLADPTADRLQLAAALHDGARPGGVEEGAVERLLLTFEELASNALRHGRGPVRVTVTTAAGFWLIDVSDAAVDRPPVPAVGRDAARGGLGLYLVARICDAHGWTLDGDRKHVWARIDHARAEAPNAGAESVPRPRSGCDGRRPAH